MASVLDILDFNKSRSWNIENILSNYSADQSIDQQASKDAVIDAVNYYFDAMVYMDTNIVKQLNKILYELEICQPKK